jgi:hypothetical protein
MIKSHGAIFCVWAAVFVQGCATVSPTRSFADLPGRYLSTGDVVDVRQVTGEHARGRLVDLSPASLTILNGITQSNIAERNVIQIRRERTQRARLALVGLGAGFVIGVGAARSARPSGCSICDSEAGGLTALVSMAVGAAAGALAGTFVKAHNTVYEAPRPTLAPKP